MKRSLVVVLSLLAACNKPHESEQAATVRLPLATATAVAKPDSPDAPQEPLVWTHSQSAHAAWYGPGGGSPLLAISCEGWQTHAARLVIVRYAPADKGAGALFAIQGSKGILRLPVSAVKVGRQGYVWRGILDAADRRAEVLLGDRLKATVPGGGELDLPPLGAAGALVSECVLRQAQDDPSASSGRAGSEVQTLPNRASNPETSPADR